MRNAARLGPLSSSVAALTQPREPQDQGCPPPRLPKTLLPRAPLP